MKSWLKGVLFLSTTFSGILACTVCFAQQNWETSPQNWRNSPDNWLNNSQNWENSSQNWKNNPQNWQNNPSNYNSTNGIYDSNGNRVGYSVPNANGGVNYFNNDGSRRGYAPAR
jgi:hypothetical protein